EITSILEQLAPLDYAEDFDNVGLLIGDKNADVSGILVTLDTLEIVIEEAISKKCNLIVSFHPIIFNGLKKITGKNYVERTVLKAIKNDIAIYAAHTALDNCAKGVNAKICEVLGQVAYEIQTLENTDKHIGMGMIGELEEAISEKSFLIQLKSKMNAKVVRHSELIGKHVKKIAVLGGSGAFAIGSAKRAGADMFITADVKYHQFYEAEKQMVIADIGHFETEQFTKNLLVDYLTEKIPNFAIHLSESLTNPIKYF
ncbi:UNVERIFIED_CONTAM: hypothetical protein GTU68_023170, partial [Idotea baltica]|nr:hypothetical protein [Idotea baltica]